MKPKNTIFLKPAAGIKIRFPDRPNKILPEEGANVAITSFWMRRIREGSVKSQRSAEANSMNSWPES